MQRGDPGDVITVPEWSDVSDWAAVCDPRIAPAMYVGERFGLMPEIFFPGRRMSVRSSPMMSTASRCAISWRCG